MEEKFKTYLLKLGLKGAPNNYPQAINIISQHYTSQMGNYVNIYSIKDLNKLKQIVNEYEQSGKFSTFGYEHHGRFRAAIKKYLDFFEKQNIDTLQIDSDMSLSNVDIMEDAQNIESVFTYEKDLQNSLCSDVESLFSDYKIFGNNNEGVEFSIKGKRIDILLSHKETGNLLAIELKSGIADYKVFGQISMYLGLLQNKFPDKLVNGLIIAGTIDDTLSYACSTSNLIALKTYKMKLQLIDYSINK